MKPWGVRPQGSGTERRKSRKKVVVLLVVALVVVGSCVILFVPRNGGNTPAAVSFTFAAGGDHGNDSDTDASLEALAASDADFYLALGDMSYQEGGTEPYWCDRVRGKLGPSYPFELLAGNHEDDAAIDGWIGEFAKCLPDRLNVTGTYAAQYYFDYPPEHPIARLILLSPDLEVYRHRYAYAAGDADYAWVEAAIDGARASGIRWIIVGTHGVCITVGVKHCEIGEGLFNLLLAKKVDLVLQGHDHNVQRSKQLSCDAILEDGFDPACVADDGTDGAYAKGAGIVVVISGSFGVCCYDTNASDPEAGYFAKFNGESFGFWTYAVDERKIVAQFVRTGSLGGSFEDAFTIEAP